MRPRPLPSKRGRILLLSDALSSPTVRVRSSAPSLFSIMISRARMVSRAVGTTSLRRARVFAAAESKFSLAK